MLVGNCEFDDSGLWSTVRVHMKRVAALMLAPDIRDRGAQVDRGGQADRYPRRRGHALAVVGGRQLDPLSRVDRDLLGQGAERPAGPSRMYGWAMKIRADCSDYDEQTVMSTTIALCAPFSFQPARVTCRISGAT